MAERRRPTDDAQPPPPVPAETPAPATVHGVNWIGPADRSRHAPNVPAMDHETDAKTARQLVKDYPQFYELRFGPFPEPHAN